MMLGLELIRRETGWVLEATMGVDNQAAITATGMGKPAPGSYIVDKIHASYQRVTERHSRLRFTLGWVPGHKGIPGNERADEEAKRAAGGAHNNTSNRIPFLTTPLALPHYDTRDASVIADLPYMVVSQDPGQWHIALSQLENAQ